MPILIDLGGITAELTRKNIKSIRLSVHAPGGEVRISAPRRIDIEVIRAFAISKLDWIRRQQRKLRMQPVGRPAEYREGEDHWVWGRRYPLHVVEGGGKQGMELKEGWLVLYMRPGADVCKRRALVEAWQRQQVAQAAQPLIAKWEARMGVKVERLSVRRMKTRWGSCSPKKRSIRLNSELAKKSPECLEYVIVHELAHLLEPSHSARFKGLLDQFLPGWRGVRKELGRGAREQGRQGARGAEVQGG